MSPKLKVLSGKDAIKIFEKYGFAIVRTKGSHVRLYYHSEQIERHVTIPLHGELKKGTLRNIIKDFDFCFGVKKCNQEFYSK